jgi:hypothetical protein
VFLIRLVSNEDQNVQYTPESFSSSRHCLNCSEFHILYSRNNPTAFFNWKQILSNVLVQTVLVLCPINTLTGKETKKCRDNCILKTKELSKTRYSKLLLALTSTVVLAFGPRRDPLPNLCSFQDRLCVWKWRSPLRQ